MQKGTYCSVQSAMLSLPKPQTWTSIVIYEISIFPKNHYFIIFLIYGTLRILCGTSRYFCINQVLFLYFHFSCTEAMPKEMYQGEDANRDVNQDANQDAYQDASREAN